MLNFPLLSGLCPPPLRFFRRFPLDYRSSILRLFVFECLLRLHLKPTYPHGLESLVELLSCNHNRSLPKMVFVDSRVFEIWEGAHLAVAHKVEQGQFNIGASDGGLVHSGNEVLWLLETRRQESSMDLRTHLSANAACFINRRTAPPVDLGPQNGEFAALLSNTTFGRIRVKV